jgi:hypothetical protein
MTLTCPILNRCRKILWVVTGSDKVAALAQPGDTDRSIPAGQIQRENARDPCGRRGGGKTGIDMRLKTKPLCERRAAPA